MDWTQILLRPDILALTLSLAIPIVAIVVWGITFIVKRLIVHRERMAMIERGLHPDYPPEEVEAEEGPAGRGNGLRDTRGYTKQ